LPFFQEEKREKGSRREDAIAWRMEKRAGGEKKLSSWRLARGKGGASCISVLRGKGKGGGEWPRSQSCPVREVKKRRLLFGMANDHWGRKRKAARGRKGRQEGLPSCEKKEGECYLPAGRRKEG